MPARVTRSSLTNALRHDEQIQRLARIHRYRPIPVHQNALKPPPYRFLTLNLPMPEGLVITHILQVRTGRRPSKPATFFGVAVAESKALDTFGIFRYLSCHGDLLWSRVQR